MSNYYIQSMNPQEISSRFSTEEIVTPFEDVFEYEWKEDHLEKIRLYLPRLPDKEADFLELYYFYDKKQTEIAQIFELTQAAVSYRIKRGLERLRFLMDMPDWHKDDIRAALEDHFIPIDVQIFQEMFETTCQSEVANRLKISQGKVRHRFLNALQQMANKVLNRMVFVDKDFSEDRDVVQTLKDLQDCDADQFCDACQDLIFRWHKIAHADLEAYDQELVKWIDHFVVFQKIRKNFNILREVELPKWHDRSSRTLA